MMNLPMSYASFDRLIVAPHKVNLTGWPEDVPRIHPQKLNAAQTEMLYDTWNDGGCHWYKMTKKDHKSVMRKLEANGGLETPVRQKHSNAGQKRKSQADSNQEEEYQQQQQPTKKTKPSKCSDAAKKRKSWVDSDKEEGDQQQQATKKTKSAKRSGTAKKQKSRVDSDKEEEEEEEHQQQPKKQSVPTQAKSKSLTLIATERTSSSQVQKPSRLVGDISGRCLRTMTEGHLQL